MSQDNWNNRIVGLEYKAANQLQANPKNPRRHPSNQRQALRGSLDTLGWYDVIIENRVTGELIDGHARVEEALTKDETMLLPVLVVEMAEHEQDLALAQHDWITQLADYDRDSLDSLLQDVQTDDNRLQVMLAEMAEGHGIIPASNETWDNAFGVLADSDRAPYQQKTFTLHDSQVEKVDEAIKLAHTLGDYDTENENSNGNGLARISEWFLESHG